MRADSRLAILDAGRAVGVVLALAVCVGAGAAWATPAGERTAQPSVVAAQSAPETANLMLAQELLALSNATPVLAGWRETLSQSADYGQYGFDKDTQARLMACWRTAVLKSFNTQAAEKKLASLYAATFKESELKELIALRRTPIGEKISRSELAFHAKTADAEKSMAWMIAAAARLEREPRRKALIMSIAELGGGAKALTDALTNISVGASVGAESIKPAGQPRHSVEEIVAMVEEQGQQMWRHLDTVVVTQHEMLYEELSLDDLGTLKAFMESKIGQRQVQVSLVAFNRLMRDEALAIGARFAMEWQSQEL